jgi:hypothetical protein
MSTNSSRRPTVSYLLLGLVVLAASGPERAAGQQEGDGGPGHEQSDLVAAIGPDVTVFQFTDVGSYGNTGGIVGYSVGTRSCNRGSTPLNWCDQGSGCAAGATNRDHPVIAQNLFRLKDGRFDQIGMSWLKHGYLSTNSNTGGCSGSGGQSCTAPPAGSNQLGVGCTDPYGSGLNGSRPLGMRSEVNSTTGAFPFPYTSVGSSGTFEQRIKVQGTDVDSALNPGATYFAEAQYIAPDDAAAGNGMNNASYRQVTVGSGPGYPLTMTGSMFEGSAAIEAWKAADAQVERLDADVPSSSPVERFQVARKVTQTGPSSWHFEYAIRNHNSDRAAQAFAVDFPDGTSITNAGFHDVDSHSGEPYSTTDWTIGVDAPTAVVSWTGETFATNANANALRWATMYNFWFDSDSPHASGHSLTLFKPGVAAAVAFDFGDLFSDGFESNSTAAWSAAVP